MSPAPDTGYVLSVTKGCSCRLHVRRETKAINIDYRGPWPFDNCDVSLSIDDRTFAVVLPASVIVGNVATFTIPPDICNKVRDTFTTWQVLVASPDPSPLVCGKFERHDGGGR